jgi:Insertion domain in 60S ribosomal protein L10P
LPLYLSHESTPPCFRYFDSFSEADYARAGTAVEEEMSLAKGPLPSMAASMEPYLRKLGLPTKLVKGRR